MDPFSLPVTLLLDLLKYLPDLQSLQSLRRASPAVDGLLHVRGFAAEVAEAIISTRCLVSTQFLIRTAALIVWGPHPENARLLHSFDELRDALHRNSRDNEFPGRGYSLFGRVPELPGSAALTAWHRKGLPAAAVLAVLALAATAHKLAHCTFHTLLDRALAAPARRPVDPLFSYDGHASIVEQAERDGVDWPPPPEPESEPVVPAATAATDPPSWGEQQILEHGAWAFVLYSLVVRPSPPPAASCHRRDGPATWWPFRIRPVAFQPFWKRMRSAPHDDARAAIVESLVADYDWAISSIKASVRAWDKDNNNRRRPACCTAPNVLVGDDFTSHPSLAHPETSLWLRGDVHRAAFHFCRRHTSDAAPWSPIYAAHLGWWHRLGFQIWTKKRMANLGFMVHTEYGLEVRKKRIPGGAVWPEENTLHADLFAWRSVLTADEVRTMETQRRVAMTERREDQLANLALQAAWHPVA